MATKLSDSELQDALAALPGWCLADDKLHREYLFTSFSVAISFMVASAAEIEQLNHHPEWSNIYDRVTVDLMTHDVGGITRKDVDLATAMEEVARKLV